MESDQDAERAFVRLHELVGRGYQPELGPKQTQCFDAIWLHRPNKNSNSNVVFYLNGKIVGKDNAHLSPHDEIGYQHFHSTVSQLTWRQAFLDQSLRGLICQFSSIAVVLGVVLFWRAIVAIIADLILAK